MDYTRLKKLATELGVNREDVIALSAQSDPFYVGSPTQLAMAQWFARIWEEKGFTGRGGVHLRRAHYQLLGNAKHDGKPYVNSVAEFNYLIDASRYARYTGLVDPEDIIDRRNPSPRIFLNRPEDEEEIGFEHYLSEMVLPQINTNLLGRLEESLEEPWLAPRGYDYHDFHQPHHVEVWVEKSTMNDVLEPVCSRLSTNLVTGVGYLSITAIIALLRRVEGTGKPARILYVSDMDAAGKNMPVQVGRQCEFWIEKYVPDADIRLEPIVLTPEQVEDHDLGRMAITDEETGEEKIELDALEGLVPGELAKIVEKNIKRFRDEGLRGKFFQAEREARKALEEALEEELGDELASLEEIREEARPIVERYQQLLVRLARRMDRELTDARAQLEDVRLAVENGVASLEPELPPLPDATVEDPDDEDWLFDSRRDYMDQLGHYKSPEDMAKMAATRRERSKVCQWCGTEFLARRKDTIYCQSNCRMKGWRREQKRLED